LEVNNPRSSGRLEGKKKRGMRRELTKKGGERGLPCLGTKEDRNKWEASKGTSRKQPWCKT